MTTEEFFGLLIVLLLALALLGAIAMWMLYLIGRVLRGDRPRRPRTPRATTGWPLPSQYGITTAYGKRGRYWSCNSNSSGGVHTGADFAAPVGTPVYATIAGTLRFRNYGSAFGTKQVAISPSPGQPFANGEVFYAHMSKRIGRDGDEVQVGDKIGEVGAEGNVSGPHLHYEFHPNRKNAWNCSVHADPSPTLSRQSPEIGPGPVYLSKLTYGQRDSDSVSRLQDALNGHPLKGGKTLPVTGNYLDETDNEVRLCQQQHGFGNDPAGESFVGARQAEHLFAGTGYTIVDDTQPELPPEPPEPPDPEPPDPEGPPGGDPTGFVDVKIESDEGVTYTRWITYG